MVTFAIDFRRTKIGNSGQKQPKNVLFVQV